MIPSNDVLSPLLHGTSKETFLSPDSFFREFYRFYCNKGTMTTMLSEASAVLSLAFAISFSVYLFEFVDWNAVMQCTDEETCHALNEQFASNPFQHTPKFTSFLSALYFLLFLCVWLWRVGLAVRTIQKTNEMSAFCRDKLRISEADLETVDWPRVLERLIFAHKAGVIQILPNPELTVNDVVLRIMRSDNYLIALINRNCLHMFLPWWLAPFFTESVLFSKSMEWSVSYCVLSHLFDDDYRLAPEFLNDVGSLRFRFQIVGLLQLILLPFTLLFVVVFFLMENFQQFHSNRAYLGPRQWTPLARWEFREFNELPHLFEQRLNRAYEPALSYLNSFSNASVSIVAEFVAFVSGALVAVMIIVSFMSEGALLYIHIADRNLLWYLGIFSACFAASRACIPDSTKSKPPAAELLAKASAMTHHFPSHWKDQELSRTVRDEVSYLLQHKIVIFLHEILGVLLTPIILMFSLPMSASVIVDFVKKHTRIVNGIGAICDYSLLELDKYGDNQFGSVPEGADATPLERLNFGKLEKSFLNFKQTYTGLVPDKTAHRFQDTLSCYKEIKREQRGNLLSSIIETQPYHQRSQSSIGSDFSGNEVTSTNVSPRRPDQPFARSNIVTSTFYDDRQQERKSDGAEMGNMHSPELRSLPFPKIETSSTQQTSFGMARIPIQRQSSQTRSYLFSSTIPSGNSLLDQTELPDVLLSVLREQNIDYRNDFYWLNRFHAENRQNPVEMGRSILQFRQQQHQQQMLQQYQSGDGRIARELSNDSAGAPSLNLPGGHSSVPTSPTYPDFNLGGGQPNNIFMPPTWSPPPSSDKPR
jgi:hypothetical protein